MYRTFYLLNDFFFFWRGGGWVQGGSYMLSFSHVREGREFSCVEVKGLFCAGFLTILSVYFSGGPSNSADNTLNRPRMDLGGNHASNHSSNHQHNNGASHHQSHDRPTYEQSFQNPNYPSNNGQHNYQPPNHYQTGDELRHQNERDNYGRVNEPIRVSTMIL